MQKNSDCIKVCKFGGTSMASAYSFATVKNIILSDNTRKFIVVSAPGKCEYFDTKITDLLIECSKNYNNKKLTFLFDNIVERFEKIRDDLNLNFSLDKYFYEIKHKIKEGFGYDYLVSRGEYLSAILFAQFLDRPFLDAVDVIKFVGNRFDEYNTYKNLQKIASVYKNGCVIPGFYGVDDSGKVKVFGRGGSDITGAIVAAGVDAILYENWTDVNGFLFCDPKIYDSKKTIHSMSYKEMSILSKLGANVLHEDTVDVIKKKNIPINIKNTFDCDDKGTFILPDEYIIFHNRKENDIIGVSCKESFCCINIQICNKNIDKAFLQKIDDLFCKFFIKINYLSIGIDNVYIVFESKNYFVVYGIIENIEKYKNVDKICFFEDLALIGIVGWGLRKILSLSSEINSVLSEKMTPIKVIVSDIDDTSIIFAVDKKQKKQLMPCLCKKLSLIL